MWFFVTSKTIRRWVANCKLCILNKHDDVIKWKHFRRCWPFVRGIHRSPANSPHKGQWRGALMFSLICAWMNRWVKNREAGDLRRHRAHYDVTAMNITDEASHNPQRCAKKFHYWLSYIKHMGQFTNTRGSMDYHNDTLNFGSSIDT